jgi:threonine efflux protein
MTYVQSLLSLSGIFLLACCSPGPVFLLIASSAAQKGRAEGIRVGLGVASATFVWASFTVLGLGAILASVVWAQSAIRLIAGLYLLWLGIGMVRSSLRPKPDAVGLVALPRAAFESGFIASITNPKALAFFGSAFALTSPAQPTLLYHVAAVIALTLLSAFWHSFLAVIFATPALQHGYRSLKRQINLCVGILLACLGGGMLTQALRKGD